MTILKRYLIAGLLVWLPLGVTIAALIFLVNFFDRSLLLLPEAYRPEALIGFNIPGLGILLSLGMIILTGMLVANFLGSKMISMWESLLARIPLVRSIYTAVKQISEAVFGSGEQTFQKVYLIQYPRVGLWTLAFQTSTQMGEAQARTGLNEVVNMFVPTTPNPTSGFFIMASRNEIIELDLSVDEALKMVISGGVVVPPWDELKKQEYHRSRVPSEAIEPKKLSTDEAHE
ncbi:DUF502 domain-containing protein [Thiomicrorhabdus sp. ZW0627]|uniref:DUF502 domain-containing protein n=1 Tax=Thiomicrorhabdus sp. ZW0627 TaxID=3039774 RepID=UPI002436F6C5|nr:DUF502 domain-containing protein [Thiomicrorhabdus sp. ZW0627]MDG6772763.1 DUF502 domain-containing protein [Thiomicrorhabdus sp. ZW0627]